MEILNGVYAKISKITIGTGSTSKATDIVTHYYAEQVDEKTVSIDILGINNKPSGIKKFIDIEDFKANYKYLGDLEDFDENTDMDQVLKKHIDRGNNYLKEKKFDFSEQEFNAALNIDAKSLEANHGLSKVYLETEDYEKANEILMKMGELDNLYNSENKHIFNEFAINLRKQKLYDNAISNYNKALAIDPQDEILYYNLARAYFEKGDFENAKKTLEKALEINNNFNEAKKFLNFINKRIKNA